MYICTYKKKYSNNFARMEILSLCMKFSNKYKKQNLDIKYSTKSHFFAPFIPASSIDHGNTVLTAGRETRYSAL